MTALTHPAALLDAWEQGIAQHPVARVAVLLCRAGVVRSFDEALDLDLGTCAELAFESLRALVGDTVEVIASCDACGEILTAELSTSAYERANHDSSMQMFSKEIGRFRVRSPSLRDLLAAAGAADPWHALVTRCVHQRTDISAVDPHRLTPSELASIDAVAEELAGAGDIMTLMSCPACGAQVYVDLDPGALLWEHVARAAPALLADVATLAAAFGWTEPDVLALSSGRRRAYLTLARR